jgi:MoaA/NifB/PqqE/SkfB family radical SAM enzyme
MADYKKFGETFCVLPWIQMMTRPNGALVPCCVGTEEVLRPSGLPYYLWESTMSDAWNSPHYQEIRKKMLSGEKVSGCQFCYNLEGMGLTSYRQSDSENWLETYPEIEERIEHSRRNDYQVEQGPMTLDLRLGNLCNLRCRSCHPDSSSELAAEWKTMMAKYPDFNTLGLWSGKFYNQPGDNPRGVIPNWSQSEKFWQELDRFLPYVKRISLAGGEPQMLRGNYLLLERCIDADLAKDMELLISSNMTIDSDRFRNYLPHFKRVKLNCSVDAFGKRNHYLRYPALWEAVDKNIREALRLPMHVNVNVVAVVQYHNVLNLDELFNYVEQLNVERPCGGVTLETIMLQYPKYLSLSLLPEPVKHLASERIRAFSLNSKIYKNHNWSRSQVDAVIRMLGEETPPNRDRLLQENRIYTLSHDESRAMKLEDYFGELHSMLG